MNDYELLRKLASGERDPIGDLAQEIVEELQREIEQRGTQWHDIGLAAVVEDLIRANRLIAAAPDLLNGCNALLGLIQLWQARPDAPDWLKTADSHRLDEARAANAKVQREAA